MIALPPENAADENPRDPGRTQGREGEEPVIAERVRSEVTANVGHELLAPLGKLLMQLRVLKECSLRDGFSELATRTLGEMERTLTRQLEDIRCVLALSGRKPDGNGGCRPAPVNLHHLMLEILDDQGADLRKAGVTIIMNLTSRPVLTRGDVVRHVFRNLLENAIKYRTRQGHPWLRIFSTEGEDSVSVTFVDNGMGLSQEEMERVFDRSYQAETSSEGCGLGLSLSRAMLEELGGRITIRSPGRNRGVSAVVELPNGRPA